MIETSHQQARFLIRRSADRRLPEEQWSALQAHLERCVACRAYAAGQRDLQRGARRALLARWRPVEFTAQGMGRQVIGFRQKRAELRRTTLYGLFGLVAALLIVLLSRTESGSLVSKPLSVPLESASLTTPTAQPTPTSLPEERFIGVVAYQSAEEGNSDIFLINATPNDREKINLTAHPAEDTGPSWSPDGEWLAFLSDRAGKRELFVISVAGTRLTRLTVEPQIDWQGVPQWSSDGRWISLTGKRLDEGLDSWVYLIPLDGSEPVSLPGTRGSPGGARFSPLMPLLAVPTADGGLLAYSTATGWYRRVLGLEEFAPGARFEGFDWAFGDSLVYQVSGPVGSSIAIRGPFGPSGSAAGANDGRETLVRSAGVLQRSLAFQPGGALIATLRESATESGQAGGSLRANGSLRAEDCWTVRLLYSFVYDEAQVADLPGLCALSELESASWHPRCCVNPGGSWLVMAARPAGAAQSEPPGIYALRAESQTSADQPPPIYELLADLPEGLSAAPVPRMRPVRESLDIVPQPAAINASAQFVPPALIPRNLPGSLLLAQAEPAGSHPGGDATLSAIYRADPGGGNRVLLLAADAANTCPAWSLPGILPAGNQIAFLSDRATREMNPEGAALRGPDELFVMDAQGENITQVTRATVSGRAAVNLPSSLSCPVWSPDGKTLAVVSRVGQGGSVMVMTPDGQVVRYAPSQQAGAHSMPVWNPDGRSLLLPQPVLRGSAPRILEVPLDAAFSSRTLAVLTGWDDVHGLSISPDGQEMAIILVREAAGENEPAEAVLRVVSLPGMQIRKELELPDYNPAAVTGQTRIAWTPDRQLIYVVPHGPLERHKASLLRYDPASDMTHILANPDDVLLDWDVSSGWVIYSTESGLWGVPVEGDFRPIRLSPESVASLSWR